MRLWGVYASIYRILACFLYDSWIALERATKEGESPVNEIIWKNVVSNPEYHGAREIPWESAPTMG